MQLILALTFNCKQYKEVVSMKQPLQQDKILITWKRESPARLRIDGL
jgi:hypothetical protein